MHRICFFQPPIVILNCTVLGAANLEAKDADGMYIALNPFPHTTNLQQTTLKASRKNMGNLHK